jgi:hypothetical protein
VKYVVKRSFCCQEVKSDFADSNLLAVPITLHNGLALFKGDGDAQFRECRLEHLPN